MEALEIIDRIEAIRGRNNKNWMDLVRLAFRLDPNEAAKIMTGILEQDEEISKLAKLLTRND